MRLHSLVAAAVALAAVAAYKAAPTVVAQGDGYPFEIGEVVTFTYPENGQRDCRIEAVRGAFARCGDARERTGPTYGRPVPPEEWINVMQVSGITRAPRSR